MAQGDDGWSFQDWVDDCLLFKDKYLELLRNWNRLVPDYNAAVQPKPVGRPLAANEAQQRQVLKLHRRSRSLRKIAVEVQIPLNTVRTIIAKTNGADRLTKQRWQKLHPGERWEERSYVPVGNEKLLKRIEVDRKGGDGVARAQADHQQLAQAHQRDGDEGARVSEGGEGPRLTEARALR
jgi:hypothetical protein